MRLRPILCAALGAAACLAAGGRVARASEAPPRRVVSLNLCADELILRLADRAQVAAVTWLARDPRGSTVADAAAGLPVTRGLSEEVIDLHPDLVVAGTFTTRSAVGMLKRVGLPVLELGLPADLDGVRAQIRTVAAALGHPERGEAMIADLDARLARIAPASRPLRALVMRPNAFTVAPGSLGDAIIRAAGLVNVAAQIGRDRSGQVPLEVAALADADLIVLDEAGQGTPSLADALLYHPVLAWFRQEGRTVAIPNRLWTCPGPQIAEVVERLAAAANTPLPSVGHGLLGSDPSSRSRPHPEVRGEAEPRRSPPEIAEASGGLLRGPLARAPQGEGEGEGGRRDDSGSRIEFAQPVGFSGEGDARTAAGALR